MGKHEGGTLSPLSLCSGDQQRTRERDITVFESDFFLADEHSRRVRSGLATLHIQIDYVNSRWGSSPTVREGSKCAEFLSNVVDGESSGGDLMSHQL